MSAIRKTYIAKYKSRFQTYIYMDGKKILCEFKSASRNNKLLKGIFSTNNPELIKALESDSGYGKDFILNGTSKDESGVVDVLQVRSMEINPPEELEDEPVVVEVKATEVKADEVKPEELKPVEVDIEKIGSDVVSNVQEAKEYLRNRFPEYTARQLGNKSLVLEVAKEKNIVFEAVN